MKQWKAIVSVLFVFLLGFLGGALVTHKFYQHRLENIVREEPGAMREMIVRRLSRELNLDPGQMEQLRAIVGETHVEMRKVRRQIRPQIEEVLARSQSRVRAILRPDQLEKYEKIVSERKKRHWRDEDAR